jgi:FMN-dependent NADH-azoreductase
MTRVLHVAASARGAASISRRVAGVLIAALSRDDPTLRLVERDLAAEPPPHPDAAFAAASLMAEAERGDAERRALERSEALIAELEASDIVVVSTPMHNFAAPSALKAWIDYVVRPGRTFRVTPTGKVGLLIDRPTLAIVACGGRFDDRGPGLSQVDHLGPYLRTVFATVGLTDFELFRLEQLRRGPEAVERGLAAAGAWIEAQRARLVRG